MAWKAYQHPSGKSSMVGDEIDVPKVLKFDRERKPRFLWS